MKKAKITSSGNAKGSFVSPVFKKDNGFFLLLGIITGISLLLRGIVCWQLSGTDGVLHPQVVTDMATYYRLAVEITQGHWPEFYDYQPFYYAVFLSCLFWCVGAAKVWVVLVVQSLLGGASVWLTGLCGAKIFGRKAGICAALLLCICRFHIFYTPFMLLEVLQSFWMVLILYLALSALQHNRPHQWLLLAFVCGCSTLTRGNALLFVPGFLIFCLWNNRKKWLRTIWLLVGFIVVFYLPQLPFSWQNYRHFGEWRGPSVAQNKVLALGNTPEAPPGGLEYPPTYHYWVAQADNTDPAKRVGILSNIWRWIKVEPWGWPELKIRSVLLFWDATEIPNNVSIDYHGADSRLLNCPWLLNFSVIGSLGLAGCLILLGNCHRRKNILLLYMIGAYWVGTSGFYMLARFRIGALGIICVAGGFFLSRFLRRFACWYKTRNRENSQILLKYAIAMLSAIFVVNNAFACYQEYVEVPIMKNWRPDGLRVNLPESATVYDHGPLVFGGCQPLQSKEQLCLKKSFVVPDDFVGKSGKFRLLCLCNDSLADKMIVICGNDVLTSPVRDGHFLVWNVNEFPKGITEIRVTIPAENWRQAIVYIDFLRRYGRSEINGQHVNGEIVAEIQIPLPHLSE